METIMKICKLKDGRLAIISGQSQESMEFFLSLCSGQITGSPLIPSGSNAVPEIASHQDSTSKRASKRKAPKLLPPASVERKTKTQISNENRAKRNEVNDHIRAVSRQNGDDAEVTWCEFYNYASLDIGFNPRNIGRETKTGKKSEKGSYINTVQNRGKLDELLGAARRYRQRMTS